MKYLPAGIVCVLVPKSQMDFEKLNRSNAHKMEKVERVKGAGLFGKKYYLLEVSGTTLGLTSIYDKYEWYTQAEIRKEILKEEKFDQESW